MSDEAPSFSEESFDSPFSVESGSVSDLAGSGEEARAARLSSRVFFSS